MRRATALLSIAAGLLLAALTTIESPAAAQQSGSGGPDLQRQAFSVTLADWNRRLDRIDRLLSQGGPDVGDRTPQWLETLSAVQEEAQAAKAEAESALADATRRLETLGPPPVEGEPPEPSDIRRERADINEEIGLYRSRSSLADLALTRARSLEQQLSRSERTRLIERLTTRGPLPYAPDTVKAAAADLLTVVRAAVGTAPAWWRGLPSEERVPERVALVLLGFIAVAFAVAFAARRILSRRFGARPTPEPPSYSQRLIAAVADGLGKGLIPAAVLGILAARATMEGAAIHGDFGALIGLAATLGVLYILATALPHAVLSPEQPEWRLTRLEPANAARILTLIRAIALMFCLDVYLLEATRQVGALDGLLTADLNAVWTFLFNTLQALAVFALLRPSLWRLEDRPEEAVDGDEADRGAAAPADEEAHEDGFEQPAGLDGAAAAARAGAGAGFWRLLRFGLATLAVIGLFAPMAGYTAFGNYLLNNLLFTGLIVGVLYILRGMIRELIGIACSSRFLRETAGMAHKSRARLKFWSRAAMDLAVIAAGVLLIAPGWGLSQGEILRWLRQALGGFTIGAVTISVADIVFGLLAFSLVLVLTGAAKRMLADRVLPETDIDEGVRHSVTAGVGYAGFVIAVALAIAVMGVDLSNIAIIAGALSVGIGFGLQNIVNNFVSGLILLIERPIKAGDWVVVGQNEGFVKQISMRATEIETWHRASVIVPNADLLSSALKNWTHKDKYGRVDVPVGVALDSDPKQVEKILLQVARRHPRVVRWPQPVVLLRSFGTSRLEFELRVFTDDILWVVFIGSELRYEILRRFREEGVILPYDHQVLHLTQGDPQRPDPARTDPAPGEPAAAADPHAGARDAAGNPLSPPPAAAPSAAKPDPSR
ncbi:MAG: mechanosensitive ion channel [Alphaproteobacteria bacterium]|nr:mechanosensitive ion channel [Alphaproteobacteria bacterium]